MANKVQLLDNRWDDQKAATLDEPGKLLYRSNLLGADKRITNYGGGNTSAKVSETDPLTGKPVEVLWVKGSGGDVGTIKLDGFATLYMEKLESLKSIYKGVADEDRMVGFLPHCTFNLNSRAASIDTPLHGFVPFRHVDHMHPDAIIAIAASKNSRELTKEVFGDEIGWLPWRRPGFQLGLDLGFLHAGKLSEAHLHDGGRLDVVQPEALHQSGLAFGNGGGLLEDLDHLVDEIDGGLEALEDVSALLRLAEVVAGAAHDDVLLMADVLGQRLLEVEQLRLAV